MMDFFVNTVKLGHQTITANPSIFKYSFDKRIYPRYNVLKVLESKKLIRVRKTATFLKISEEKFLENYITKYEGKVPGLLEIYGSIRKTKGL
jgi:mTERF domain-containing protein